MNRLKDEKKVKRETEYIKSYEREKSKRKERERTGGER